MREKYESLSLATLKDLAKARGLKGVSALRKPELIERMLHEDELEGETKKQETVREKPQQSEVEGNGERIPQYNKTPERTQYHAPAEAVQLDSGERADGTVEREQTEFLRYFRMDMGLSDVRIIFRGKMIFMYHLLRYADLT